MTLTVVKPASITDAVLINTDVAEADYPVWSASTTYAVGSRVILVSTHKIYESLQNTNLNNSPATATTFWNEVTPTNRWKLFDLSNSTQTTKSGSLFYELKTGSAVNAVSALNLSGVQSIRIRLTDPVFGSLYDKTTSLTSIPSESSWYAWFFSERIESVQHVALDLPSYPNATVRVDLTGTSTMAIGVLMIGQQKVVSEEIRFGMRMGIRDYSRKEKNEWGDVVLVERAFSKTRSFPVQLRNDDLDRVDALLASLRAKPCLWVGSDSFSSMTVFGYPSNFEIVVAYARFSDCTIDIEGLT